jgi:hypothetical protein
MEYVDPALREVPASAILDEPVLVEPGDDRRLSGRFQDIVGDQVSASRSLAPETSIAGLATQCRRCFTRARKSRL